MKAEPKKKRRYGRGGSRLGSKLNLLHGFVVKSSRSLGLSLPPPSPPFLSLFSTPFVLISLTISTWLYPCWSYISKTAYSLLQFFQLLSSLSFKPVLCCASLFRSGCKPCWQLTTVSCSLAFFFFRRGFCPEPAAGWEGSFPLHSISAHLSLFSHYYVLRLNYNPDYLPVSARV